MKLPSAEENPANQFGSDIFLFILDLSIKIISEKAAFNLSDKPKFIVALMATILVKPSGG